MRGPLVVKRALGEPLLLLAAFCSILLTTTALVALTMYASAIAGAGVRRAMETASYGQTTTTISAQVDAETFPRYDRMVRGELAAAYGAPPAVTTSLRSDSYVMPGQDGEELPELLRFGSHDGLGRHARPVEGRWPGNGGEAVEAAISEQAAEATGFEPGEEFVTKARLDGNPVRVRVVGVFRLDDPVAERWAGEELLSRGVERGEYTTYGPLMVAKETFVARFATGVRALWVAEPELGALTPERLRPLAEAVSRVGERLRAAGCANCLTAADLPELLTQLATASLVARSTMLIPVLQLLLLAGYALMLTARLLADHRRMEVALLRSRGAGSARLAALAGGEALLVAVPCAIVAPFLGPPLLALIGMLPWIGDSGVRLAPQADAAAFLVSSGVALAAAVLLALPAVAGARRTYVEEQSARGRGRRRGLIQGAGADLALLAVAALAIWQLQRYGAPVTATASGGLGIDPLIISGPALALLAGGLLGLRLVPRVSRQAERLTSRLPGLAPALGAWQVSRRPLTYAGPALLLTLAIAIGVVSMATTSTWQASQRDQADHQASADLRLSGPPEGPELGVLGRGTAFTALPGVTAASPAFRAPTGVGGESALLLALDAGRLGEVFRLRPDLSARTLPQLSAALRGDRTGAVDLPGRPRTLTVRVESRAAGPARLVLSDGLGVWHDLPLGDLREGGNRIELDLAPMTGRAGAITCPLSVRGLVAGEQAGELTGEQAGLRLTGLSADGRDVSVARAVAGPRGVIAFGPPGAPGASGEPGPLPVVLTSGLAATLKLDTGESGTVRISGRVMRVRVAGIVTSMPTSDPGQEAVLADWETLQAYELAAARPSRPATEWWLAAGDTAPAREILRRNPQWDVSAVDRRELGAKLRDDPLAGALQGALTLAFAAALGFAVLGFLVNAVVAARQRRAEFAVLRALGTGPRQVFGMLATEQAFVIGLSLVAGTGLAVVVGNLVVPRVVLTGQASAVTPGVLFHIPWAAVAGMLALVTAVLVAIVAVLARRMWRGQALEER
ncbi:ABC transporter permease [Nonomuraea sp. KC401]|uniref:ABC transporter permease n=1 Tax=unclassified Nonomuraea TaxID=2593643 RepID=UPI0010FE8B8A|nr:MULTISPECIES: ABC transporter permease [unclassified Nonomuraea]NBE95916.1 FtsX-like permease family protein [Nonomuraea sp. K271]TLF76282.1 ABC transporter permease [Nonomuraea sp. KC401]